MKRYVFTSSAALVVLAGSTQAIAAFPASIDFSSLNGTNGFALKGIDNGDKSGVSVSSAGDVNGDGIDDIIIGAAFAPNGTNRGESYVVFGRETVGTSGIFNLSSLSGTNGFVLNGIDGGDFSGISVSSAGDVNGDGIDDLIIGAQNARPNAQIYAGESYVVFGAANLGAGGAINLSSLDGSIGFVLNGIDVSDKSGRSVSSAGDVNGDGIDDIIIGAPYADANGKTDTGESYVVFGTPNIGAGGSIELSNLNGANGFVLNGIDVRDWSGYFVSSAGDINGDNIHDIIIGAMKADPNGSYAGESYIVFGATNLGAGGLIELSSLDGTNGFVLNGIDADDRSGRAVSLAGDVNGDGFDDIIISAYYADPNGQDRAGESYVVFGATNVGTGGSIELSSLNGTNGFVLNGIDPNDLSGRSVSSAGDINGDGIDDLIIGASSAGPSIYSGAGESYVVFGAENLGAGGSFELSTLNGTNGFMLNGIDAGDRSGSSVSASGDVNGDGIDDIIIGAFLADPIPQVVTGESYVVFGRPNNPADLDGVGVVGACDLSLLLGSWGPCPPAPNMCAADLDGDGFVGSGDLALLLGSWGT